MLKFIVVPLGNNFYAIVNRDEGGYLRTNGGMIMVFSGKEVAEGHAANLNEFFCGD